MQILMGENHSIVHPACPNAIFIQSRIERAGNNARTAPDLAGSYHFCLAELRLVLQEHRETCGLCRAQVSQPSRRGAVERRAVMPPMSSIASIVDQAAEEAAPVAAVQASFVLRRGAMFHGPRSGSMVASPEQAKVWKHRGDAKEQADALNSTADPFLPLWTVEALTGSGANR